MRKANALILSEQESRTKLAFKGIRQRLANHEAMLAEHGADLARIEAKLDIMSKLA